MTSSPALPHHWWSNNDDTRAMVDHLWQFLIHHPPNGIYIKGTQKWKPESIEINCIKDTNIINVNIHSAQRDFRDALASSVYLLLENAYINNKTYTLKKTELIKNTFNLTLTWQQSDKK